MALKLMKLLKAMKAKRFVAFMIRYLLSAKPTVRASCLSYRAAAWVTRGAWWCSMSQAVVVEQPAADACAAPSAAW